MWNGSSDTVVEGNTFIDCDRAVAFGLVDKAGGFDHQGGVIRNNFVYQRPGLFSAARRAASDGQLLVYDSPGTQVYHNTVLTNGNSRLSLEVRWANTGVAFDNNLADAPLGQRDGGTYTAAGNYLSATPAMFVNPAAGRPAPARQRRHPRRGDRPGRRPAPARRPTSTATPARPAPRPTSGPTSCASPPPAPA